MRFLERLMWLIVIWKVLKAAWPALVFVAVLALLLSSAGFNLFDLIFEMPLIFPLVFLVVIVVFAIKAFLELMKE